ncbi:hypothetical protein BH18THE2_BH18THE2_08660 [soil metagenome]
MKVEQPVFDNCLALHRIILFTTRIFVISYELSKVKGTALTGNDY